MILDQTENDIYKGWADLRISFWECLTVFCGDPALYQRLWDRLEEERHGFIERGGYYEESLARLQLHLLTEWDSEEKGLEFLLAHLRYHSFRGQAIDEAMKRSDYEAALRYAEDGLAQDNESEKRSPGYVHEWRVASYEAYKALGNTEKVRELAEYFVKHERDGMKYYDVLKNTTPPEEWPEALWDLLAFFEAERFPSSTYSKILIVEKDFERLMSICRRNNSRISELGAIFPEGYLCEVEQIYRAYILAQSESASDRKMYKEACELLKGFGDVCGKAVMNELAQKIRAEHPRQPAFLDELGKLG